MSEPDHRNVDANGVQLNVYQFNAAGRAEPIIMLHGMRDVGLSLMPIAVQLAREHPVFLADLRGHGASDRPGSYAMPNFIYDLHCLLTTLIDGPSILFGHSLGGQIVARFAALYPDLARAAIIVEGLGPPGGRRAADPDQTLRMEGERIRQTLSLRDVQRPLPSVAFAAGRLQANNPRLSAERALQLARHGTRYNDAGDLVWAFDPRAGSVFVGLGPDDSARYWSQVHCPTLIVSGALSHEYWGRAVPNSVAWDGRFAEGELEARAASFPTAELVIMEQSGHMVHFDEPERLAEVSSRFLERILKTDS